MKVPPHATAVSQPADVAWNFPFKTNLRNLWQCNMQDQLKRPRPANKKFELERPGREQICGWIRQLWNGLAVDTIANGFKASGLLPDPHSFASSDLVAQLEELSLLEGPAVDEERDFAHEATV
ncbi:hypothetical protein DVH05_000971 [Phytophthora capsici]|nr:hypothetical protein DVH05_000971 [Phytophthora capsici]